MEKAETVFALSLQWVKGQQRAWVLTATVFCPAMFSLFTSFQDSIQSKVIWWSFLIFILLIWLTGTIFALGGPKTPLAVLQEVQSLREQIKISQENLELVKRLGQVNNLRVTTILKWLDLVAAKAADGKIDDHTFDLEVSAVLSSLINYPEKMFLVEQKGYWTASVYLYNQADHQLYPIARETNQGSVSPQGSRVWPNGIGQVGFAYQRNRRLIIKDLVNSELVEFIKTPERLAQETDAERYRSMAAIPLRSRDRDTSKGCLIVTANQPSALSEETTDNLVLDAAAVSISTLLELYGADNHAIIQSRYSGINDG